MIDFKVTFYMHDGSREIYNNLAHIEFYNEFVLIQDWNGATLTIENNKFDRFDVVQYYDI